MTLRPFIELVLLVLLLTGRAAAQPSPQTPLPGKTIPQWMTPLPRLDLGALGPGRARPAGTTSIPVVDGTKPVSLYMCEFKTQILPTGTLRPGVATTTWVWGYVPDACPSRVPSDALVRESYVGPVVVVRQGTPTPVTFTNDLGSASTTNVLAYKHGVDQTLHWADPVNGGLNPCADGKVPAPFSACSRTYTGPIPATPHLHGGEVPPELDGGPNSWFTSDGATAGAAYYPGVSGTTKAANRVTYRYPNSQEAAPAWFHDHTLGTTRLNVYAGLAGAYIITDTQALPSGFPPVSSTIPLVIQDRMFDTDGQLLFPAATAGGKLHSPNPEHPYWVPEFLGDVIVVNGKAWPYLEVEPRRYRFLILNGSNSRTYDLSLPLGAKIYVIGNDGGYLDVAKPVKNLVVMPGERYDTVIDFGGVAPAAPFKSVVLANAAHAPYPQGAPPTGPLGQIVQFRVKSSCVPAGCGLASTTWNPAVAPAIRTIQGGTPMVRLVTAGGAPATTPAAKRMLTLNEVMAAPQKALDPATGASTAFPGGPIEILLNNTPWAGASPRTYGDFISVGALQVSELPREGDTELWEIVNLTPDAHPVHLHLVQFQLLNRQRFDVDDYGAVYAGAFPGAPGCPGAGVFCPGFGPPHDYRRPNASGYVGGNPDVRRSLKGTAIAPAAQESGWKDTVMVPPGTVTRFVVRWSPPSAPLGATGADAAFPFDPSGRAVDAELQPIPGSAKHGYVWHCHMIDHEDNDMMRPSFVTALDVGPREIRKGRDY